MKKPNLSFCVTYEDRYKCQQRTIIKCMKCIKAKIHRSER